MAQYLELISMAAVIPAVLLFKRIHRRRQNDRRLREMYEGLKALHGAERCGGIPTGNQ